MSTFQTQVQNYVGTFSVPDSITTWLMQGTKIIINLLPISIAQRIAIDASITSAGYSTTDCRILYVHKAHYASREFPNGMKAALQDSDSIYYATSRSPAHVYDNASLFVYPGGGTAQIIPYPTVIYGDSTIDNFPIELIPGVVLYASIQALLYNINARITSLHGITISSQTPPTTPSAPSFTYTDAAIAIFDVTTIGSLGTPPTFTKPTFGGSYTNFDAAMVDEDIELAGGHLEKITAQLNTYTDDIQNEYHEFEKENVEYQSTVQKAIQQAVLEQQRLMEFARLAADVNVANAAKDLEQQIAQYSAILQKYQSDIMLYRANVEQEVQRVTLLVNQYIAELASMKDNLTYLKAEYNEILKVNGLIQ